MIDPTTDGNMSHLYHITSIMDLPAFVKSASIPTPEEVSHLPNTAFADRFNRQFPVHTKAACFLSYAYYTRQRDQLDKVAQQRLDSNFDAMGKFWEISGELTKVAESMQEKIEKVAATEDDYAVVANIDGRNVKSLPINTYDNILKSAAELIAGRKRLPYTMRKTAAAKMLMKLADLRIPTDVLPKEISSMAGLGVTVKEAAISQLKRRALNANTEPEKRAADALSKLAGILERAEVEILPQATLEKVALALDAFDRFTGLDKQYGDSLAYPEDVLFSFTKKSADQIKNELIAMTNGSTYWLSDMVKSGQDAFEVLGDIRSEMVDATTGMLDMYKVSEIVPTLPRPDANLLDNALQMLGVPKATLDKVAAVRKVLGVKAAECKKPEPEKTKTKADRADDVKKKRAQETMSRLLTRGEAGKFSPYAPNTDETKKVD